MSSHSSFLCKQGILTSREGQVLHAHEGFTLKLADDLFLLTSGYLNSERGSLSVSSEN